MTATVLHFTPKAELTPLANLEAFIEICKKSEVLNANKQFGLNVWEIGHFKGQNKIHRAIFSTLEASKTSAKVPVMAMPFLDFAKAALVYLQSMKPVVSQSVRISAFRCLEAALREWGKDSRPTAVNQEILDSAVELARNQVDADAAYRIAGQLEMISELMRTKGFISLRQAWNHGLKKPAELGSRISKESLDARQEKLPSAAALRALAGIFYQATEAPDVINSSFTAIMLCAPERINEVLRLVRNSAVEGDGRFEGRFGLRWAGSKGADDTTKWLPSEMVPVAKKAVDNLLRVTGPAQKIAAWYTANPKSIYLHEGAQALRNNKVLTPAEIALILWGDSKLRNSANTWAKITHEITPISLGGQKIGYSFEDVERAVVGMLPETFPYVPGAPELLCKDALALMRTNENHRKRSTFLCMFACIDHAIVSNAYGRPDRESIFKRFDYTEDDGSPIDLQSHSLRHYLNMLAQAGGLSSAEIAIFSGRKNVSQNRAYDHLSSDEVQAPISQAIKNGFTANIVPASMRNLVSRSEFKGLGVVAGHTTEYGWCHHNFASEPCQLYRDCLNCQEQECVKGEEQKEANLRSMKAETEYLLKEASKAMNAEEYAADIWVTHQTQTLARVNALLAIFEDPSVPDGSRIRLNAENASLIVAGEAPLKKTVTFQRRRRLQ